MDVSVIVPTRNRSAMLAMTLRSVLAQQGVDLEVIVVDDASTDDTQAVINAVNDGRLRVIRHDVRQGLAAARNRGAASGRGVWLAFIDDDDLWAPDKLARQINAADETRRQWAYTGAVNIAGERIVHGVQPPPPDEVTRALPNYNAIPGGGSNVIIRRTTWLRIGGFDARFRGGGEDWEMSLRLSKHGPPAWVPAPLVARRLHASNMSLDTAESLRAARLIETLHQTQVDWGIVHRWLAHSCMRTGQRLAALGWFARAAAWGQLRPVASDLAAVLRQRRARHAVARTGADDGGVDPWWAEATSWLREFGVR
jgi:glycosyltransferase involved in cell wall biosynthesis